MSESIKNNLLSMLSPKIREQEIIHTMIKATYDKLVTTLQRDDELSGFIYQRIVSNDYDDGQWSFTENNFISRRMINQQLFYNRITIHVSMDGKTLELIAENVPSYGDQPTIMQDNHYIYEPETNQYHITKREISFVNGIGNLSIESYNHDGELIKNKDYPIVLQHSLMKTKKRCS